MSTVLKLSMIPTPKDYEIFSHLFWFSSVEENSYLLKTQKAVKEISWLLVFPKVKCQCIVKHPKWFPRMWDLFLRL